jgi:hypothetical protein
LSERKENGTANHAEHAKGSGALQGQDNGFDLKARLAEVEQQAEMQACGFQIIQTLRAMNLVDRLGYFQSTRTNTFDEQVNSIFRLRSHRIERPRDVVARRRAQTSGVRAQCIFIDFLKKSSSQRVQHCKGAANDSVGQEVNPVLAGIHLRVLRVLRFHFPCLLPAQPFQFVDASRRSAAECSLAMSGSTMRR